MQRGGVAEDPAVANRLARGPERSGSRPRSRFTPQPGDGTASAWARRMSKLLRGLAAGWGAKKLGGGCFSTVIVFVILWYLLGHFQIFR